MFNVKRKKMKNKLITTILILVAFQGFAQKKSITKSELTIGYTTFKQEITIDLDVGDTLRYVYISFKNEKYKSITDMKYIILHTKNNFEEFKKDFLMASKECSTGSNIDWSRKDYALVIYDFSNNIYLTDKTLRAYTLISPNNAKKINEWLNSVEF